MSKKSAPAPFRMNQIARAARAFAVLASVAAPGLALAQLAFPTEPLLNIGSSSTDTTVTNTKTKVETVTYPGGVIPNVILTFDNSSSMIANSDVTFGGSNMTRIQGLVNSLNATFAGTANLGKYNGAFRLAFQSMWLDSGFGPNRAFRNSAGINNSMRVFDANVQTDFMNWVNSMGAAAGNITTPAGVCNAATWNGTKWDCNTTAQTIPLRKNVGPSTPSQYMVINAGEYLRGRVISGPGAGNTFGNLEMLYAPGLTAPVWGNSVFPTLSHTAGSAVSYANIAAYPSAGAWLYPNAANSVTVSSVGLANPWADDLTSVSSQNTKTCRRAYHVFLTDGLWNGYSGATSGPPYVSAISGNPADTDYDSIPHLLPDGTTYTGTLPLYKDNTNFAAGDYSGNQTGRASTLSDFALYYWATDLTGKGKDKVDTAPFMKVAGEGFGGTNYSAYWHPKNDPASWQHMQTFTIGYGGGVWTSGGAWPAFLPNAGAGVIQAYNGRSYVTSTSNPNVCNANIPAYDGFFDGTFFAAYASGSYVWPKCTAQNSAPDNIMDLVHSAYNGRGMFFPVTTQEGLTNAFNKILDIITTPVSTTGESESEDTETDDSSTATTNTQGVASAGGSNTQLAAGMAYVAGYDFNAVNSPDNGLGGWSGWVKGATATWNARLPAPASSRNIFTSDATGTSGTTLPAAVFNTLSNLPLGDIVNSQLVFVGKSTLPDFDTGYLKFAKAIKTARVDGSKGMVYVGANDGMMHGFAAGKGTPGDPGSGYEQFAYVPLGLQGSLGAFGPGYVHKYTVDGGMFSGDAQLDRAGIGTSGIAYDTSDSKNWGTVLVGTLAAGEPGYFALDVTSPDQVMGNLASAVLVDKTGTTDPNIGYQFGQPVMNQYNSTLQSAQIVKINTVGTTSEWAVIMGNGYNSSSGLPVLLIQSLTKPGRPLYTVQASCTTTPADCLAKGNGLGQPRAVDVDGNGTADIVYAGDLMGNLWKFDISDPAQSWSATAIFRAVGPTGKAQPITSAPVVVPNKEGGFMVGFGTGKNLEDADTNDAPDPATAPLNSFYALYDNQPMTVSPVPAAVGSPDKSRVTLTDHAPGFCASSGGPARYTSCLYMRSTTNSLALVTGSSTLSAGTSDKPVLDPLSPSVERIDGTSKFGWYYDIPETANSNTAKVLRNPIMMSDNIMVFYADNVAHSTPTGTPGGTPGGSGSSTVTNPPVVIVDESGPPAGTESCDPRVVKTTTKTVTITTTSASTVGTSVSPLKRSTNYFNLMNGKAPDNITITLDGVPYHFDNTGDAPEGNRFSVDGTTEIVRDGTDSQVGVPDGPRFDVTPANTPGRRAGWRLGR